MRVLMINEGYPPWSYGGAEWYVRYLSEGLMDMGYEVAVLTRHPKGDRRVGKVLIIGREYGAEGAYKADYIGRTNDIWYTSTKGALKILLRPNMGEIRRVIRAISPDIVHIHNTHNYTFTTALIYMLKLMHIPVIWTVHDYFFVCPKNTLLPSDQRCTLCGRRDGCCGGVCLMDRDRAHENLSRMFWRMGRAYRSVNAAICPSRFSARILMESGMAEDKVRVVPNAAPDKWANIVEAEKDYHRPVIGFVGHGLHKGLGVLLKALKAGGMDADLLAVTTMDVPEHIQRVRVRRMSGLNAGAMVEFYRDINVLVIPSLWAENCPLAAIEAMLSASVVVASDVGGMGEMIQHGGNGYLFPCGDAEALRDILMALADDNSALRDMGLRARSHAKNRYNIERHVETISRIYGEMI